MACSPMHVFNWRMEERTGRIKYICRREGMREEERAVPIQDTHTFSDTEILYAHLHVCKLCPFKLHKDLTTRFRLTGA